METKELIALEEQLELIGGTTVNDELVDLSETNDELVDISTIESTKRNVNLVYKASDLKNLSA